MTPAEIQVLIDQYKGFRYRKKFFTVTGYTGAIVPAKPANTKYTREYLRAQKKWFNDDVRLITDQRLFDCRGAASTRLKNVDRTVFSELELRKRYVEVIDEIMRRRREKEKSGTVLGRPNKPGEIYEKCVEYIKNNGQ